MVCRPRFGKLVLNQCCDAVSKLLENLNLFKNYWFTPVKYRIRGTNNLARQKFGKLIFGHMHLSESKLPLSEA